VAESSLGPKGAAWELFQVALHTSTLLPDDRDSARGSSIPPTEWTLSREARNRLVHAYNGNAWQGLDVEYRQWLISRGFDEAGFNDSSIQNKIALSDQYNASRTATAGQMGTRYKSGKFGLVPSFLQSSVWWPSFLRGTTAPPPAPTGATSASLLPSPLLAPLPRQPCLQREAGAATEAQ